LFSFDSELLRQQRRQLGLTQGQFGKIIGVTGATVGNWERAISYPNVQELSKIAITCGVSDIDIYFYEKLKEKNFYEKKYKNKN